MKPEQQRIAIAKACGWQKVRETSFGLFGCRPEADISVFSDEYLCAGPVPDYLSDLNAMHEAEKVLSDSQCKKYRDVLVAEVIGWSAYENELIAIHATAAQRAEAFLRTIGKWVES